VLTYEMVTGQPPFMGQDKETVFKRIRTDPPKLPAHLTGEAKDFIIRVLSKDPSDRLGATGTRGVLTHDWFKGVDEEELMQKDKVIFDIHKFAPPERKKSDSSRDPFQDDYTVSSLPLKVDNWEYADEGAVPVSARNVVESLRAREERVGYEVST